MPTFLEEIESLIARYAGSDVYTLVEFRDLSAYGGAIVVMDNASYRVRFTNDRRMDFYSEVASHAAPGELFNACDILLLASGAPVKPSNRMPASHDLKAFETEISTLLRERRRVEPLLTSQSLEETRRRVTELRCSR